MSDSTPRLGIADMPDTPELFVDTVMDALYRVDAFTDLYLKGQFVNTPPATPSDGDCYLIGGAPSGDWSGYAYKIAYCRDSGWDKLTPFNGLRAFVQGGGFIVYVDGAWIDWNALISAAEVSIASAATCDLGAAGSLFLQLTGTAAITSFGAAVNCLRFLRFAGALTLTYDAASLVLPGGANIVTAAGDTALFASDAGGHWRCRYYQRANGVPLNVSAVTGAGAMVLDTGPALAGPVGIGMTPSHVLDITQNQAGPSLVSILNNNSGGAAYSGYRMTNGTSEGNLFQLGTGNTLGGIFRQNGTALIGSGAGGLTAGTDTAQPLYFAVNSSEAGRVGTDKSLLWGATANGGWSGGAKIEAESTVNGGAALSGYINAGGTVGAALLLRTDSAADNLAYFTYGTAKVGAITTNGVTTTYGTTSDARLKTVRPQQGGYRQAIRALWVGDFTWKDSGAPGFGVLAQQAWEVMPNHQGVTRPVAEDEAWQASAEPFAHLALWGVKDLYAMIETLAARVAALEAADDAG